MTTAFEATLRKQNGDVVVKVAGEVDLTTVEALTEPFAEGIKAAVEDSSVKALSVDLRQVDFIDSAGLALLINARKRLVQSGRALQVFVTKGQQQDRVLCLGRFDMILNLKYDLTPLDA